MALIPTVLAIAIFLVFPFGQLLRLSLFGINFPLIDTLIPLLAFSNIGYLYFNKKLLISNRYLLYFSLWAIILLIFHSLISGFSPSAFFYLIRLIALLSFIIFPPVYLFSLRPLNHLIFIALITSVIFGLIQYLFWPDFTYFDAFNWDPHLYRLVGSFFDPTFTALIYLVFLIYLFFQKRTFSNRFLMALVYLSLALTYSRSTYLAFIIAFSYLSIHLKKPKIFLVSFIIVLAAVLILPRQPGEGTKLERTSSIRAKIENYRQGIKLYSQSPLIGIGYNRLPQVRADLPSDSHAIAGFDSSLLTILITTGPLGLFLFSLGILKYLKQSSLLKKTIFVALLVHSLFANSLLYPWIFLISIFI